MSRQLFTAWWMVMYVFGITVLLFHLVPLGEPVTGWQLLKGFLAFTGSVAVWSVVNIGSAHVVSQRWLDGS